MSEEAKIKDLMEAWAAAVRRHDIDAIVADRSEDILMFDLPESLQCRGMEAYKKTWELLFKYHTPADPFDIKEIEITAGKEVAYVTAIMRCVSSKKLEGTEKEDFLFRLTVGLKKVNDKWRVTHEHHSLPFT